jgi:hypothetical protein
LVLLCLFLQPQWSFFLLPYRFIYSRTFNSANCC